MLSPLGGFGSGVENWNVKQTGALVRVESTGIVRGGPAENGGGVGLMTFGGEGGVAPWGNLWYVVAVNGGWFVPLTTSETSGSGRPCTVSALIESCAGSEFGMS